MKAGKGVGRIAIGCIVFALIAAGCYCAYRYYQLDVLPEKQLDEANEEQLALFSDIRPADLLPENTEHSENTPQGDLLGEALEINSGAVAWVTVPGTNIDYPIAQGEDNSFYLTHGFDGKENGKLGCPFLDYRCEPDFSGFNSIVYAHHLKKRRMFADINLFKDQSFLRAHSTGTLTLNSEVHTVRFFAYLNVYSTAPAYHAVFVTDGEKREYLEYLETAADYCTMSADALCTDENGEANFDDLRLLLLSTCTYEFDNARGILVGVIE